MINITKYEFEQIRRFEEETLTDYGMKQINEDEYYIREDMLMSMVGDLLVHYHRKVEELEDLQADIDEYYMLKPEAREVE